MRTFEFPANIRIFGLGSIEDTVDRIFNTSTFAAPQEVVDRLIWQAGRTLEGSDGAEFLTKGGFDVLPVH